GQTEGRPCEAVLPLLAATLERLWEGLQLRPGATSLSAADYQGGAILSRALALTAESAWQALPLRLQPMARRLLLLLVHPLPVSGGTLLLPRPRREDELLAQLAPAALMPPSGSGQLTADSPARQAADALVRLLTAGILRRENGVIELGSAALLGEWKELGRWPEEERRFLAWHRETLALVQREVSRPSLPLGTPGSLPGASLPGVTLQGAKLAEAERWLAERGSQIDPKIVRLIVSCVTQRDRRVQSGQVTAAAPRRLTWALAILAVLLAGGLVAQWQRQKARRAEGYFQLDSERGARAALLVQQPGQDGAALALAISAAAPSLRSGRKTPPLAKDGLMLTYTAATISRPLHGHSDSVEAAVFDPSGQRVLTGSRDQTARLWNARTGEPLLTLTGHGGMITSVNFSPDGSLALTTSNDGTARIWDSQTGALRWVLKGHTDRVQMAVFSPLGDRVVTASHDHSARIWDSRTGQQVALLSGHSEPVIVAAFLPSGRAVLTASFDKTVRLWDSQTGALLKVLCRHTNRVNLVAVTPDGERVVTGSWDQTALLWNLGPAATPAAAGGARAGGAAAA
ncbi:MAG TPA: WD40 repeat domain-containing protein, partial [Pseudomonadota bacterium]|nr:WD40 repeat domain-containing protein [Pseudomonadota bacterium]